MKSKIYPMLLISTLLLAPLLTSAYSVEIAAFQNCTRTLDKSKYLKEVKQAQTNLTCSNISKSSGSC